MLYFKNNCIQRNYSKLTLPPLPHTYTALSPCTAWFDYSLALVLVSYGGVQTTPQLNTQNNSHLLYSSCIWGRQEVSWPRMVTLGVRLTLDLPIQSSKGLLRLCFGWSLAKEAQPGQLRPTSSILLPGPEDQHGYRLLKAVVEEQDRHWNHQGSWGLCVNRVRSWHTVLSPSLCWPGQSCGWAQSQGEGMKPSSLPKNMMKGVDRGKVKNWGHYCHQTQPLSTRDIYFTYLDICFFSC